MDSKRFNKLLSRIAYDDGALSALYDYFYPRIVLHMRRTYPYAEADDIAQEFFLRLLNSPCKTYVLNPASWVYASCENLAKQEYAESAAEYPASDVLDGICTTFSLEDMAVVGMQARELFKILEDDKTKRIIYLYHWEGYNLREISEILGLSPSAVRQRYSRAIRFLKKF